MPRFARCPVMVSLVALIVSCVAGRAAAPDAALAAYLRGDVNNPGALLTRPDDRVVLVLAGAGFTRVSAWAPITVAPEILEAEMKRAVAAAGLTAASVTSLREYGYTRARARARHPQPLVPSGTTTLRYGAIVAAFRQTDRPLHAALGHYDTTGAMVPAPVLTEVGPWQWRDVRGAAASETASLSARFSTFGWLLALLIVCLPFVLAVVVIQAVRVYRAADETAVSRAARLSALLYAAVTIGVGALVAFVLLKNRHEHYVLADLWFGSSTPSSVRNVVLALVMVAIPVWVLLKTLRSGLIVIAAGEGAPGGDVPAGFFQNLARSEIGRLLNAEAEHDAAVDPEERILRARLEQWRALIKVVIFAVAAVSGRLLKGTGWDWFGTLQWPLAFVGVWLVDTAFKKRLAPYEVHTPDPALLRDAQALALRLGVAVHEAEVDDTWAGRTTMSASFSKGRLVFSRRALRELTPAERDYMLLRTMLRVPAGDPVTWTQFAIVLAGIAVCIVGVIAWHGDPEMGSVALAIEAGTVVLAAALLWLIFQKRAQRAAHDRLLSLTLDPASAESALAKWRGAQESDAAEMPGDDLEAEDVQLDTDARPLMPLPSQAATPGRGLTLEDALQGGRKKGDSDFAKRFKRG